MKIVKTILIAAFAMVSISTIAQDFSDPKFAKWGETAEERTENITKSNFFREASNNREYNLAMKYFNELVSCCPTASETIYAEGIKIYKNKINGATNLKDKNMFIDSMLLIYDLRMEHFGSHKTRGTAYLKDRKAREYLTYRPNDRAGVRKIFTEAIDVAGSKVDPNIVIIYFSNLADDYNNTDDIYPEMVIEEYDRLSKILISTGDATEQIQQLDNLLGLSGAADCATLETLFKAKIGAAPDDIEVLKKAIAMMARAKCMSEFYLTIAEKYYSIEPSANAAMALAQAFQDKGDFTKASKYLNDALDAEQDPTLRKDLLIRISLVALVSNNYSTAITVARQARSLDPENGVPYFIMAQCYANTSSQCDSDFGRQTVYWVAYDTMAKAIQYLPADSDYLKPAKASLSTYRSYFPSSEECFFNEVKEGTSYKVSCGLASGITTTVRFN